MTQGKMSAGTDATAESAGGRDLEDVFQNLVRSRAVAWRELEAEIVFVSRLADAGEEIGIVDLADGGLVAAGIVGHVEVADLADVVADVARQVSLGDLLVVDVEQ